MTPIKWLPEISLEKTSLYYRLNVLFWLIFLYPVLVFVYYAWRYDFLTDPLLVPFVLLVLFFALIGFTALRKLFDRIINISTELSARIGKIEADADEPLFDLPDEEEDSELQRIISSVNSIEARLVNITGRLEEKSSEVSILKELADLCYVTLDPAEILYVTLERALLLTNSDIGSVMIIDKTEPKSFVVKASIGLGERVKIGDRLDFDKSIAKYAVINKSPLVIEDIEKDTRFGRSNRPGYATKSFICLPIKTINDIIGVLTISRKQEAAPFKNEDVEALIPLLSNAAFTYENIRLLQQLEQNRRNRAFVDKVFKVLGSSLRGSELLHTILNELRQIVPFSLALVLLRAQDRRHGFTVSDMLATTPTDIAVGSTHSAQGSIIDTVLRQESMLIIDDTSQLTGNADKQLFHGKDGKTSGLIVPLSINGRGHGVLVLAAPEAQLLRDNRLLLEWTANVLSLALRHNQLTAAVIKRDQEMKTIRQIGDALASSTFDISKVLQYTMEMIRESMDVEAGVLFLLEDNELKLASGFNIDVEALKSLRLKLGEGIAGSVAARGESMLVNDTGKSSHFSPEIDKVARFTTTSALCVPIISQGQVVGVIEVLNKTSNGFDDNDKALLHSISSSVSIAVENSRLYKETVSLAEHERGIRQVFQKFVPREVVDQITRAGAGQAMLDEFKTLTLLNIDLRSFSDLTRQIGPQKTVSLLNHFFSVMGTIVFKHHGIVDKYLGDGFLAIFGAPASSSMDAENAVVAALEMQAAVGAVNDYFIKELGASVSIGISIHTGEVVVGNIGFDMKMDYTVIGDPVNAVFRIQEMTKTYRNGILVGEDTCRAARSALDLRETGKTVGDRKVLELLGMKNGK
ncbi:MAG: GAF domain-containing protein [Desulfobacterales bacterium]|nr:GAF domain-containing protein [Desulfobacterales bacterium]